PTSVSDTLSLPDALPILASGDRLLVQMPIVPEEDTEPEPDLAVIAPGTGLENPTAAQVTFAIEVAERSRRLHLPGERTAGSGCPRSMGRRRRTRARPSQRTTLAVSGSVGEDR